MNNELMGFVIVPNASPRGWGKCKIMVSIHVGYVNFTKFAMEKINNPSALNIFVDEKEKRLMAKKAEYGSYNSFPLAEDQNRGYQFRINNLALSEFLSSIFGYGRLYGHLSEESEDYLIFKQGKE